MSRFAKPVLAGILLSLGLYAGAVPAKPGVMTMVQADGTELSVRLVGDENAHQYFTPDGYLLVNIDGNFYYGNVDALGKAVSSGVRAFEQRSTAELAHLAGIDREFVRAELDRGLALASMDYAPSKSPGLFPEERFPGKGNPRTLVILVEYADVAMTLENAYDYFNRACNEEGFSDYGATGSCHDYFLEQSLGQFDPVFDVYGPVTLSHNRSYYGGNDYGGNDQRSAQMILEACQILDDQIDYTLYDTDGNGEIDNVFVFYAGRGEASGGPAESIWPHSWNVCYGAGYNYLDGKLLGRYACTNEWEGNRPDGIGTFVHEFSHVLGLPDLYATSYTNSFTPGSWSALDYGPYNNNGMTPPNYGAFERYALEWMEPVRIEGPMSATLPVITDNVAGIIYDDEYPNEYFLFENRQKKGWDTFVPGHGMLVWHIDYNSSVWSANKVNNTPTHQYADIEEADGKQSEYSRAGDAFPGTSEVTSFTDETTPGMKRWTKGGFGLPITDIAENDGVITFNVLGGAPAIDAPVIEETGYTFQTANIAWNVDEKYTRELILTLYKDSIPVSPYINYNCGTTGSVTLEDLEPEMAYTAKAYLRQGLQKSNESEEITVYTGRPTLDYITLEASEAEDVTEESFVARWVKVDEATDYLLSVQERVYGAPYHDICDFTDGTEALPEGWSVSNISSYANSAYSGKAVPALRMGKGGDNISSPTYDDGVTGLSFWHRGSSTSTGDQLNVSALVDGEWQKIATIDVVSDKGGVVTELTEMPVGTCGVRIDYVRNSGKGSVAIDDVEVLHGKTYENVPVESLTDIHTGDTDYYVIEGLKPETTYLYTVVGTDGTLVSRRSNTIVVSTTAGTTGVESIVSETLAVRTNGHEVEVRGAEGPVQLYDLAGRIVASGDAEGRVTLSAPGAGIYFLRTATTTRKVVLR